MTKRGYERKCREFCSEAQIGVQVKVIIMHQLQELCRYDSDCGSGRTVKEMMCRWVCCNVAASYTVQLMHTLGYKLLHVAETRRQNV
jgi:hypothetical protein